MTAGVNGRRAVSLRPLLHTDLDRVSEFELELFGAGAWSKDLYAGELEEPARCYVAAVDPAGALVGYAGVLLGPDAEVMTIGVTAAWRRRGVGARLLDALIDASRAARSRRVFLEVRTTDEGAQRLYARAGFRRLGVRRGYYQPENADALVMRLDLAAGPPVRAESAAPNPTQETT